MNKLEKKISCPNCGTEIDVNEIIYHQLEDEMNKQYRERWNEKRKALEIKIKKQTQEEQQLSIAELQKELNEKTSQINELNRFKIEIQKLKREKDELREKVELEAQQRLNQQLSEEKEKIQNTEKQKNALILKELNKQLEDQKKLTEEMKRKQEQGSMQLQGEVQELAIEEWLHDQFPLDTITEIKKGERGADCLQTVNTTSRKNCGSIYYESKRTKAFQATWIEKFKEDIRKRGADIGVLVTEVMPKDMERLGLREGIWICTFDEFRGLCSVLRESLITLSHIVRTQENKGDKMSMVYDYLTGKEFRMQVEAIVEGFTQMRADLDSEKRAMISIWKKREKQIEKVLLNTSQMHASIRGIAGTAIQAVPLLELPTDDKELF